MELIPGNKRNIKHWTNNEKAYLFENIDKKPIDEICKFLNRNERSVKLFIHRHAFDSRLLKDTLLLRMLKIKFNDDPSLFRPNKKFYESVKVSQKHYYSILKGDKVMTDEECLRIADFFKIDYESIHKIRQLELFEATKE